MKNYITFFEILLSLFLVPGNSLQAQHLVAYPSFDALVTAKNFGHFKDAHRSLNEASVSKLKFNIQIDAIRNKFWKLDAEEKTDEDIAIKYANLLHEKDMWFLFLRILQDHVSKGLQLGNINESIIVFDDLTGGALDKGINRYCQSSFDRWTKEVSIQYFKESRTINIDVDLIKAVLKREDVKKLYSEYAKNRDISEAYDRNKYTKSKYKYHWDQINGNKHNYTDPYERLRYLTSLEKFEKEIQSNTTIDILTKYEASRIEYSPTGGATHINPQTPYVEGEKLYFPQRIYARVLKFGNGDRPTEKNKVKLTFFENAEDNDNSDQIFEKTSYNFSLKVKPKKEVTLSLNEVNTDLRLLLLMMEKGSIWFYYLSNKYGDLIERDIHYGDSAERTNNQNCWIIVRLDEILE